MESKNKANEPYNVPPRPQQPNWSYHNPTPGEFPIMASDPRTEPAYSKDQLNVKKIEVTKKDYDRLRECGFNIVRYNPWQWTEESISTAWINGMALNMELPSFSKDPKDDFIAQYYELCRQSLLLYTSDETHKPYYDIIKMFDFGDETKMKYMIDEVSKSYALAWNMRVNQLPIFNRGIHFPKNDSEILAKEEEMQAELETLQSTFHPAVWCYDFYPIIAPYEYTYINEGTIRGRFTEEPRVEKLFIYGWKHSNVIPKKQKDLFGIMY